MKCNDDTNMKTTGKGQAGRIAEAAKVTVSIRHMVRGSLCNEPGDKVLSATTCISHDVEQLCGMLAEGASNSHASFFVMTSPNTGMPVIAHVQGAMTVFGNGVRNYCTRAVYECETDELGQVGGFSSLLPVLDGMRRYEQVEFDVSAERKVEVDGKREMTVHERALYEYMAYCVAHDTRLFIRLGEDELRRADDVRRSARLAALLHAIDHLPPAWRDRASLAFSVECKDGPMQELLPSIRFIAHHDPIDEWDGEAVGACCLDWTSPSLAWAAEGRLDVRPCIDEVKFLESNVPQKEEDATVDSGQASETPKTLKSIRPLKYFKSLMSLLSKR
ncbi:MAG: hypothetical protein IKQ77_00360 [Prevotella sp.]|nr:hypothetical protein [Prevotella sp.]